MRRAARRESSHGGTAPTRNGARCHVVVGSHAARSTHSTATTTPASAGSRHTSATGSLTAATTWARDGFTSAPLPHNHRRNCLVATRRGAHPRRRVRVGPDVTLSGGHPGAGELPTQPGAERAPGPPRHLDDRRAHHVNPTDRCPTDPEERAGLRETRHRDHRARGGAGWWGGAGRFGAGTFPKHASRLQPWWAGKLTPGSRSPCGSYRAEQISGVVANVVGHRPGRRTQWFPQIVFGAGGLRDNAVPDGTKGWSLAGEELAGLRTAHLVGCSKRSHQYPAAQSWVSD